MIIFTPSAPSLPVTSTAQCNIFKYILFTLTYGKSSTSFKRLQPENDFHIYLLCNGHIYVYIVLKEESQCGTCVQHCEITVSAIRENIIPPTFHFLSFFLLLLLLDSHSNVAQTLTKCSENQQKKKNACFHPLLLCEAIG